MEGLITAFGLDWRLLIIQGVNFAVLLAALTYFLYTPVTKMIDERREKIAEGVRKALAADEALAAAKSQGENMIGTAAREAEGLVATARLSADDKAQTIVRTAESRANALLKDAQARAEEAKRLALQESSKEIARAAMLAAEKLLREKSA